MQPDAKTATPTRPTSAPLLKVEHLRVGYGDVIALHDVSLEIFPGELISVIGSNGAGKTTLLKTISGFLKPLAGEVSSTDGTLSKLPPHKIVERGLIHVPEGRRLFSKLDVRTNLILGAYSQAKAPDAEQEARLKYCYELFPILKERQSQKAGTLSGGEQQMVAIARGLMAKPRLLMLDEPSLGVAPLVVRTIFETLQRLKEEGLTILLVEQNVKESLQLSNRAYVLQTGQVVTSGPAAELLGSDLVRKAYLGI
jgi:branched-chain amino acid transport system ATP-binding protein